MNHKGHLNVLGRLSTGIALSISQWQTNREYLVDDLLLSNGEVYYCLVAHTSGVFATDIAKWVPLRENLIAPDWAAATPYIKDQIVFELTPVSNIRTMYRRIATGISGGVWDATEATFWEPIANLSETVPKIVVPFVIADFVSSQITVLGSFHGRGLFPHVQVLDAANDVVLQDKLNVNTATGDIVLTVLAGDEHDGTIIIS